ncbi:probable aldehyde reductase [Cephalotrichum gorgonifer]|uniref:Probable aldehyde reductase n=1 Tax=Cephalotrichum gorgonifer TaxID=2041049 RepID=A0AAE8SWM9_9PEZI|nr:probable aldehyde reductase [Cephalotrichum gorgonifer]
MTDKTFKLNTGQEIPALLFGTWQGEAEKVKAGVTHALLGGYKGVDGAYCYANEDSVGEGLRDAFAAGVKREDVFIVSKVWCTYQSTPERVAEGIDKTLKSLGVDYLDLALVHWPVAMNPEGNHDRFPTLADGSRDILHSHSHVDTWKSMEKLLASGKTKAIGVSNYSKRYLEELLPQATVVPAVNQIENHPQLRQQEIVGFCREKGIHIMAYSPFGSTGGPLMSAGPVVEVADRKGVKPATILLSYHVARGNTVIAKSVTPERIDSNKQIVDLDAEDLKILDDYAAELERTKEWKRYVYPAFGVDFGFPDKS